MAYLRRPYYVGLLSAAALHGAAHQSPQEFQVVTDRPLRPIEVGRTRIRFVKKAHLAKTPTVGVKAPTGEIRVSSPEATALDLVRYPEHAGYLSNVATILSGTQGDVGTVITLWAEGDVGCDGMSMLIICVGESIS